MLGSTICFGCLCCPNAKKYGLLPLFVEVVPQSEEVRLVVVHFGFGGVPQC